MKERPILFSGTDVRAILEGRKTQTRRVVKPQPYVRGSGGGLDVLLSGAVPEFRGNYGFVRLTNGNEFGPMRCPYGRPGDLLWVRETYTLTNHGTPVYRADAKDSRGDRWTSITPGDPGKEVIWKPSIHMPRWASRLTLRITSIRVERLQDISEGDAIAEGAFETGNGYSFCMSSLGESGDAVTAFEGLWDSINGKTHPWESNPWVWFIEFEVAQP